MKILGTAVLLIGVFLIAAQTQQTIRVLHLSLGRVARWTRDAYIENEKRLTRALIRWGVPWPLRDKWMIRAVIVVVFFPKLPTFGLVALLYKLFW